MTPPTVSPQQPLGPRGVPVHQHHHGALLTAPFALYARCMTICFGFNFGRYALLAADTRVTYWPTMVLYDDDNPKVHRWTGGLVTAAGLVQLIDPVQGRLAQEEVPHTTRIKQVIEEERRRLRSQRRLGVSVDEIDRWIAHTGWLVSYTAEVDGEARVRVAVLHPSLEDEYTGPDSIHLVPENTVQLIVPPEADEQQAGRLQQTLQNVVKPLADFATVDEHYAYHRGICGLIISQVAQEWQSVSSRMQLGVHTVSGQVEVTGLLDAPERDVVT